LIWPHFGYISPGSTHIKKDASAKKNLHFTEVRIAVFTIFHQSRSSISTYIFKFKFDGVIEVKVEVENKL
jgi:hypothetical protein